MVSGIGVCGPPRHKEPHQRGDENGESSPVLRLEQTETEHEELDLSRAGGSG